MQLAEAVEIVQQKFIAESRGETVGEPVDRHAEALARFPVMMEVAAQIFAAQIIARNIENHQQAARERAGQLQQSQQSQQQ